MSAPDHDCPNARCAADHDEPIFKKRDTSGGHFITPPMPDVALLRRVFDAARKLDGRYWITRRIGDGGKNVVIHIEDFAELQDLLHLVSNGQAGDPDAVQ